MPVRRQKEIPGLLLLDARNASDRIWPFFVFEQLRAHLCAVVDQWIEPSMNHHADAVSLGNAVRTVLMSYVVNNSDALFCVTLRHYCDDLGLNRDSTRKRAGRGTLAGAFRLHGKWMVCGLLPIARA